MPKNRTTMLETAQIMSEQGNKTAALELLSRLIALHPNHIQALCARADLFVELDMYAAAQGQIEQVLAMKPKHPRALMSLGILHKTFGRMEEARALFDKVTALNPLNLNALFQRADMKKFTLDDADFQLLLEIENAKSDPALYYTLGKAYDDIGRPIVAFDHYARGAKLQRRRVQYNEAEAMIHFDRLENTFGQASGSRFWPVDLTQGSQSRIPVFIVGMPRSGSTLIEQILTSHPHVAGIGENILFDTAVRRIKQRYPLPEFPFFADSMTPAQRREGGQWYADQLESAHPTAARVTNKMLDNYRLVGFIAAMLPRAIIIHARRNPMDCCFSSFSKLYRSDQGQTYSLPELGRFYVRYHKFMAYQEKQHENIVPVDYENMIADTEGTARDLIDRLGLEWNNAVLDFTKNRRAVKTSSISQVRSGIYKTAVHRWKRYGNRLDPLRAIFDAAGIAY